MTISFIAGRGVYVTLPGQTVILPLWWSVWAIEKHLKELQELYG